MTFDARIADKMKSVKANWENAPSGLKKNVSLNYYQAAEKFYADKNTADTNKQLDRATRALS